MTAGRPRILFLLPFPPRADAPKGGTRVAAELVARLAERSPSALVCVRGRGEEAPIGDELRRLCELVDEVERPVPGEAGLALWRRRAQAARAAAARTPRWVAEWALPAYARRVREVVASWRPDIVHVHYTVMGQYLSALEGSDAARVLVVYEPAALRALDDFRKAPRPSLRRVARRVDAAAWARFERRVVGAVDASMVFTERDRDAIVALGGSRVVVAPFGIALPPEVVDPTGSAPANILFFGNFTHFPNVDAARRLVESVYPRVRAVRADATLTIVGPEPPDGLVRAAGAAVEVTGEVPDLRPFLDRAAVVALPLRVGAGMRIKMLEAFGAGKAVVASSLAAEGLDVVDGRELVLAETDEDVAGAIASLLGDPARRRSLAAAARAWAEANAGWEPTIERYERLHAELLESRATAAAAR